MHFSIAAALAAPAFAQVYKWVDERGITHYGERPPRGAKATEVQDKLASPPPTRAPAPPAQKDEPRAGQPPANPGPTGVPPPSPAAAPATKAPPTPQEQQAAARKGECDKERAALARLRASTTSYSLNEKGERVTVDNSAAIAEQAKRVSEQCGT